MSGLAVLWGVVQDACGRGVPPRTVHWVSGTGGQLLHPRVHSAGPQGSPQTHTQGGELSRVLRRVRLRFRSESNRVVKVFEESHLDVIMLQLMTLDGVVIGEIYKQFSNIVQEAWTNADNYILKFPRDLSVAMKALVIGAALQIVGVTIQTTKLNVPLT